MTGSAVSTAAAAREPADDGWGRGRHPVIHVSYNDISQQYLPWLSKVTGFTYRLPTEAEWELASQGGNKSSRGGITEAGSNVQLACSYGNSSDVAAKMRETIWAGVGCNDGFLYTAPTGSLSPNSLGIFDMHGNVWEWVSDCWRATYDTEERPTPRPANTMSCGAVPGPANSASCRMAFGWAMRLPTAPPSGAGKHRSRPATP